MQGFLRQLGLFFLLLMAACIALTVAMDPYDYWGTPRIEGLNARRPAGNKQMAVVKRAQYARAAPVTVVAGNSRVQTGVDPASAAWPEAARPVYNYGLAGRSVTRVVPEVIHAMDTHRPQTVYLGLDLIDFVITEATWRAPVEPPFVVRRTPLDRLRTFAEVSLSLTAVSDALLAIPEQHEARGRNITPLGANTLDEYRDVAAREGYAAMFKVRNRENFARYAAYPKAVRWPGPGGSAQFAALARMEREARARGVKLVIFTFPYHADILVGFRETGLLPAFLDFRRALVEFGAATGVPVYDFTRVNAITTEPVPPPGDRRTETRWYWEAGHFKAATGDRMARVMAAGEADPAFGAALTPETLPAADAALVAGIDALAADEERMARLRPLFPKAGR